MEVREFLGQKIAGVLQSSFGMGDVQAAGLVPLLEIPKDRALGDWAFPCFFLAKQLRKAPPAIAGELKGLLEADAEVAQEFSRIEVASGYLNFTLNPSRLVPRVVDAVLKGELLARRPSRNEHVMIEYSQLNTHKACHVGHTRAASLGDSLVRILEWLGNRVTPVNYPGDEGTHVARCLWYYTTRYKGPEPETNRGEFLGQIYTEATALLELSTYSRAPYPGITAARVLSVADHPAEPAWTVVELDTKWGRRTVVCGLKNVPQGALVAYAAPGMKVSGKAVGTVQRKGVESIGMICAEDEIGISADKSAVVVIPEGNAIGTEVAEVFRVPGACDPGESILEMLRAREQEVSSVLQRLESNEPAMKALWDKTRQWSIDEFHEIYGWLDCRFDHFFFESEFGGPGKEIAREFEQRGVFVPSEGTVGADLSDEKLGFCILVKSDGTATYACRDLALARRKFEDFGVDVSAYVVDSAQTLHFQQVFACLRRMGFPQASRCRHLPFAQVVRPDGKMSSRRGNVILFSELRNRLTEKLEGEFLGKYRGEWPDAEIDAANALLARATIRYGMLKQDNNSVIVFDLDEWTARSGDTGPYMLYAYARIRSILREVRTRGVELGTPDWTLLAHESEVDLVLHLDTYAQVVRKAGEDFAPNYVCAFAFELARRFNRMYMQCSVVGADTPELRASRLGLIEAAGAVLQHALGLLGIATIERM